MMKKILISLILILSLGCSYLYSSEMVVPISLKNVKEVKVVFDLNVGNPRALLLRLKLIEETLLGISKYANYTAVIAVRGKASDYMTKGDKYVERKDLDLKKKIYQQLLRLKEKYHVRIEQCKIALKLREIDPEDLYEFIEVVENGYISLIGYQMQGYAFIPMD